MPAEDFIIRRDKILELIIDSHIITAVPIASRTISRKSRLGLSPATIRNVMSDLEELGFIMHPHTSAGRVPTEKGYRYYINRLMQAKLLTEEEKKHINKEFRIKVNDIDELLNKTSRVLSSITKQTGLVLFPLLERSVFKHIELLRLDKKRFLVVLVTESGVAEDAIIDVNEDIEDTELLRITNFINSQIGKGSLTKIRRDIMDRLLAERDSFFYILEKAKRIIDIMLDMVEENRIYLDGRIRMAEQPEFEDAKKLKNIFRMLEDESFLMSILLKNLDEDGVRVYIGSELNDDFKGCSFITSNYCIGDTSCGTLGVIGPSRMEYAKLVSMVSYVGKALSKVLSEK